MSNHDGPENVPPPDQRCEAFVAGRPTPFYRWMALDRQCPKKAVQGRDGFAVCHVHARTESVVKWVDSKA